MLTLKDPIQSKSQQRMRAGWLDGCRLNKTCERREAVISREGIKQDQGPCFVSFSDSLVLVSVDLWVDLCCCQVIKLLIDHSLLTSLKDEVLSRLQADLTLSHECRPHLFFQCYTIHIFPLVFPLIAALRLSAAVCQKCAVCKPAVMNSWERVVFPCPNINTDRSEKLLRVCLLAGSSSVCFHKAIKNTV